MTKSQQGCRRFASQVEAGMAYFSDIEGWYDPDRLHPVPGYRSPMAYQTKSDAAVVQG